MRKLRSDRSPSLPGMLVLGVALIIGSTLRLAAGTILRSLSGTKD